MTTLKQELLDKGWANHDVGGDYPNGIMVSPDLADHQDWEDCVEEWDHSGSMSIPQEYDLDYIENLLNSPVFVGDNDWSEHIIKL